MAISNKILATGAALAMALSVVAFGIMPHINTYYGVYENGTVSAQTTDGHRAWNYEGDNLRTGSVTVVTWDNEIFSVIY